MSESTMPSGIAEDTKGQNFFTQDRSLQDLMTLYLPIDLRTALTSRLSQLGFRVANDLDDHAMLANRHTPILHHRDKFGRDRQWIEYHPSYQALEQAAFGDFGIHAMSHTAVVPNWSEPLPIFAKHLHTFLFNQAEFGLGCPINVTDSAAHVIRLFGSAEIKKRFLPRMLTTNLTELWQGAQFITEQAGGSDVGQVETQARETADGWELYGDKWFCSNADADVAMILARPEGAQAGTRGLTLFAMPRTLANGEPNQIQIVRLKDKFGTRAMASGELRLNGAKAYVVGEQHAGLVQMLEMINWSRLSNGVKSSALMRRAVHDSITASKTRQVFGKSLMALPLARRQLLKVQLASEQSMSMWAFVADQLDKSERSSIQSERAQTVARLATPVLKMRATRDARQVCGDAMEIRGGCGYIEDYINPRLVKDAHLGSIWEGTSNIIAIDAMRRAVGQSDCLNAYVDVCQEHLDACTGSASKYVEELRGNLNRLAAFIHATVENNEETRFRTATSALYHMTTAILMAWEGVQLSSMSNDATRLLWSRLVMDHKVASSGPFEPPPERPELCDALLQNEPVSLANAVEWIR